ncbi:hypothetical protein AO726_10270 [Pseudomonas sp. TTU2014-080ASC]|nr:DUF6160 family protein [Pseudomonas sp. TTU2014-080ASC]KRW59219.1 hypothetical protein AO726_10270 [Pseudomonas sp. TTU2014-080ASC]
MDMLRQIVLPALLLLAMPLRAEMQALAEEEMQAVSGQAGVSLSVSLNIARNPSQTRCAGGCGARLAFKPGLSNGYIVLDNIQGRFSFDGVTLDIQRINSGYNGEGALFNKDVLKIGLRSATFQNAQFTLAGANQAVPGAGFDQHHLFTYQTNGNVRMQGNLYIFAAP